MGIIKGQQQLDREPMDDEVGELALFEPCAETPQNLPHELKDEADVSSIGASVLKIVDDVAYVGVAEIFFVSLVAQVFEDLPLKNWVVFTVGFCT